MSAEKQLAIAGIPEAPRDSLSQMAEALVRYPDMPIEKLEKLYELQLRSRAVEAEAAFNAAMSAAQSEMGRIGTDATNPQTSSKYATYAKLDRVIRPIYTKHGFAVSFDEAPATAETVNVLAYVSHTGGHTRTYRKAMPVVTTGIKGNAMMTATHATASAGSYAKRYLVKDIFNLAIGEDDRDGNGGDYQRITESQVADLDALIQEVGADKAKFLEYMKLAKVSDMPASAYKTACAALRQKAKKAK